MSSGHLQPAFFLSHTGKRIYTACGTSKWGVGRSGDKEWCSFLFGPHFKTTKKKHYVNPTVQEEMISFNFSFLLSECYLCSFLHACMLTAHLCSPACNVHVCACVCMSVHVCACVCVCVCEGKLGSGGNAVMGKMKSVFAEVLVHPWAFWVREHTHVHAHMHTCTAILIRALHWLPLISSSQT